MVSYSFPEKKIFFLTFLSLLFCACENDELEKTYSNLSGLSLPEAVLQSESYTEYQPQSPYQIDMIEKKNKVNLSDLYQIEKTVILDKSVVIGSITKVICTDDHIFVMDFLRGVHCFDHKGVHQYSIDRVGRGPGEFVLLRSFAISEERNELLLLDTYKILRFDLAGNFINSVKIPVAATDFAFALDNQHLFLYVPYFCIASPDHSYNLFAFNINQDFNNLTLVGNNLEYPDKQHLLFNTHDGLYNYLPMANSNGLNILRIHNDTIYGIQDKTITGKYVVRYENQTMPKDLRQRNWLLSSVSESENDLVISALKKDEEAYKATFFDKRTEGSITVDLLNINDDLFASDFNTTFEAFQNIPVGVQGNLHILSISPQHFPSLADLEENNLKQLASDAQQKIRSALEKKYLRQLLEENKIGKDDNSILVFASIKKVNQE